MKARSRIIGRAEAADIYAIYRRVKSLPKTVALHGCRSVGSAHQAMKRFGFIVAVPRPRRTEAEVAGMHADYTGGLSLAALARKYGSSRRNLAEIFHRRGLAVRPCETIRCRDSATGKMLAQRRLTAAEITAVLEAMTKMEVPRALHLEWRKWTLAQRGEFIARARARLRPVTNRPATPFSANVVPFDYASPEAHRISGALNAGCTSRTKRVQLRFGSEGVIYEGKLWFWVAQTGYLHGRWMPACPRPMLHQVIWQQTHGRPVPAAGVVRFADGNPNNFAPANLVLATRNDLARENQASSLLRKARAVTALLLSKTQPKNPDHAHDTLIHGITRRTAQPTR